MSKYCKTIRNEYPYCATLKLHIRDIYLLLFYSIWTLRTTLIQLVSDSVLFICSTIHSPYSNLKFLIFPYACL